MPTLAPLALDAYDFASLHKTTHEYSYKTAPIQRRPTEPIKYALIWRARAASVSRSCGIHADASVQPYR